MKKKSRTEGRSGGVVEARKGKAPIDPNDPQL